MTTPLTSRDRYRGCLLGLACGDALGTTIEFQPPGSFEPITEIVGGGPFGLAAGQWTDDTAQALCLAESLVACHGFDAKDQMDRYCRWWKTGYLSCTGDCFDIGVTTARALARYAATGDPYAGTPDGGGNGCLMRLAPVPMFFAADPALAMRMAGASARTTHGAPAAVDAARAFGAILAGLLRGEPKEAVLAPDYVGPRGRVWDGGRRLHREVALVLAGSYKDREPPAIQGRGYAVRALEAALWAFDRGADFADVVRRAANLGDDADTTAAIAGQLAGACYGVRGIPARWRKAVAWRERITGLANRLCELAARGPARG